MSKPSQSGSADFCLPFSLSTSLLLFLFMDEKPQGNQAKPQSRPLIYK